MTITKADPNSPFWTACRENTERHERRVTTEQELAELRRGINNVLEHMQKELDKPTFDEFDAGADKAIRYYQDSLENLLARKPGAPGPKTDRERAALTSNPYYDEANHILEAAEQAYDINPLPSTPRKVSR